MQSQNEDPLRFVAATILTLWAIGVPGAERSPIRLPRSTPEAQGISSATLASFIDEAEGEFDALHSLMVVRHGKVVAEGWWAPYAAEEPHQLNSLTKVFVSTAVGLAVAERRLTLEDPVIRFFPERVPAEPSEYLRQLRVRDLITAGTGHTEQEIGRFRSSISEADDHVKAFLEMSISHRPGTYFAYNPPASLMLAAIVEKVSGQSLRDYLQPRLFGPLGMRDLVWGKWGQASYPSAVRTEDLAKIGLLYLQKGMWRDRRILPAVWVEEATRAQISTADWASRGKMPTDWQQGYGYQFWPCQHGFYRGDGAGGQFSIVMPQYDTVIAITASLSNMQAVMDLVWDKIAPGLRDSPLPRDRAAARRLAHKLANLKLRLPVPSTAARITRLPTPVYVFRENTDTIESIALEPGAQDGDVTLDIRLAGVHQRIVAGQNVWRRGELAGGAEPRPIAASGAWTADDTYTFNVCHYRTVFCGSYRLRFAGDQLHVERRSDILNARGFMPAAADPPELIGRVQ